MTMYASPSLLRRALLVALLAGGCAGTAGDPAWTDARPDAPPPDAPAADSLPDAGADGPARDAPPDGPSPDTGSDALRRDGRPDTGSDGAAADGRRDAPAGDTSSFDLPPRPDAPPPPRHAACAAPAPLVVTPGRTTVVRGDTSRAPPELTGIRCGFTFPLAGPQLYYRLRARAGQAFRFTLTPSGYTYLLVFPRPASCKATAVEAACGPAGGGLRLFTNARRTRTFVARAAGDYLVAVKHDAPRRGGPFTLEVDTAAAAANGRCAGAVRLDPAKGAERVRGDLSLTTPEFSPLRCGGSLLRGPQQYYRFRAKAGDAFRVTITPGGVCPDIVVALASCSAAAISSACGSGGSRGAHFRCTASARDFTFRARAAGDYLLIVKASSTLAPSPFALELTSIDRPKNQTCGAARRVALSPTGGARIKGDTRFVARDDLPLTCAGTRFAGRPLYYELPPLTAGQGYRLTLTAPGWPAHLVLFRKGAGCAAAKAGADCSSRGRDGAILAGSPSRPRTFLFAPGARGPFILAVKGDAKTEAGPFTLDVQRVSTVRPANDRCARAAALTLKGGRASVTADTSAATSEHSGASCSASRPGGRRMWGREVYYRLTMTRGRAYLMDLAATFAGAVYVVGDTCTAAGITRDCSSAGATGARALVPNVAGGRASIFYVPRRTGTHHVAVDATTSGAAGPFTLTVREATLPTFTAPFTLDFDKGCGGLVATGDWECRQRYAFAAGPRCVGAYTRPPPAPASGKGMWGTVLDGCHRPAGNNAPGYTCRDEEPSDDSVLAFNVRVPAGWKRATLSWRAWENFLPPLDWGEVRLDGARLAARFCRRGDIASPPAWTRRTADLSAFAGKTVRVSFHFRASTLFNAAGWYIDDVAVSGR